MIGVFVYSLLYIAHKVRTLRSKRELVPGDAVLITGCDSGIGFSIAVHCSRLGLTVVAGCLDPLSEGSARLMQIHNVRVVELDVTDTKSIARSVDAVDELFKKENLRLRALVNNAGVMIFGEFAWQTEDQIIHQVMVNLTGAMNVTRMYMDEVIKQNARIINICSHCSLEALPGLAVYAATKAGLLAWSNALRIELRKFNIPVIAFVPGAFPTDTNILSRHNEHAEEMKKKMSSFRWSLYQNYFTSYNTYLGYISGHKPLREIRDHRLYQLFDESILAVHPKHFYCHSPWRYAFYHFLFKITPDFVRDWLVLKFVNMPEWTD